MRNATAIAVLVLVMFSASAVAAISDLSYQGEIKLKFTNWDVGAQYAVQDGLYQGEANLDLLGQTPPAGKKGIEDNWGIFRVESITDPTGTIDLWNRFTADTEVTGIFWGGRDVYLNQTTGAGGTSQEIHGVGLSIAFFEDAAKNNDPFPANIAAARTAPGAFATFTDGTLIWTMKSVPGHNSGFPGHEFFTTFWPDAAAGSANAAGGFFAQLAPVDLDGDGTADDVGSLNGMIIPDNIAPGVDFTTEFTGEPDISGTWDVISDDPVRTSIPEPLTLTLATTGALAMLLRKRR